MPQTVGGKRQYRRRKHRPWYRKKYSVMDLASKAWTGVKYLKGLVNSEMHVNDIASSGTVDYTTGAIVSLNQIAIGDDISQRTGQSILVKYISFRGIVYRNSANQNETFRIMVFRDTSNQGTAPTLANVLQANGSAYTPLSNLNLTFKDRFKILYTTTLTVSATNAEQVFKGYIRLQKHVKFDGSTATDYQKDSLWFLICSDQTGANLPSYRLYARTAFYDN